MATAEENDSTTANALEALAEPLIELLDDAQGCVVA